MTGPFKKFKTTSFASSLMENIIIPSALFRTPVKLFVGLLLDQYLVFDVYLNLFQLACNIL